MEIRLQEACALLVKTNIPVADIAAKVGYRGANYFTKMFHVTLFQQNEQANELLVSIPAMSSGEHVRAGTKLLQLLYTMLDDSGDSLQTVCQPRAANRRQPLPHSLPGFRDG